MRTLTLEERRIIERMWVENSKPVQIAAELGKWIDRLTLWVKTYAYRQEMEMLSRKIKEARSCAPQKILHCNPIKLLI